jgi:fumarate hydratase class II
MNTRLESDSMGQIGVPEHALYGASTARAVENFAISGVGIGRDMIRALAVVKLAAARVNSLSGRLDKRLGSVIEQAAREVELGEHDVHFPVDVFQTGSGTSSNMNVNEVIANRAALLLGQNLGCRLVHPNDHVNMGQSSNDVFPTALHIAALGVLERELYPGLNELAFALEKKAQDFDHIVKTGRTHLMDATPIRLGQVFSGYASQVRHGLKHARLASEDLRELPIGGTAVGTGMGTFEGFGASMVEELSMLTGLMLKEAENHFEAQGARDAVVRMSGALKSVALSLAKIASDIRLLGSGPRLGLGELILPPVQPGSSMMPGKVNPVIAEALIQVAAQVVGNDAAIAAASSYAQLELAAVQPVMARNLMEQIHLLGSATTVFTRKLVVGLRADEGRIARQLEQSLALATALAPHIGYDRAGAIAQEAARTGRTVRQVAMEEKVLPEAQLDQLLDLRLQTKPLSAS